MYIISRNVFNKMKEKKLFDSTISDTELGGDVYFQKWLYKNNFKIFNSYNSYIQHIGILSTVRPGRFLRYSKNFVQPFAWNEDF